MNNSNINFDAIIVGGGHAGIEASFILAKKGYKVALVSLNKNKLAYLPCNPSIGGPAKGIITREIDALGGVQAYYADKNMIQIKMLNTSKGPAVRAIRAQIDKDKYSIFVKNQVDKNENITLFEDMALSLDVENSKIKGLKTEKHGLLKTNIVILTTGVYLDSRILRGSSKTTSGPDSERTSDKLSLNLVELGFELIRLKTGTPPRIDSSSIDFTRVEEEVLEDTNLNFSIYHSEKLLKQIHCYITYTNLETHKIILDNLNKSSMYSGLVEGIGPRYCPSIEDKIVRFQDKERHQIFFEPETEKGDVMYINGLSTSMPKDIQDLIVHSVKGLEKAKILKYGYAIEYDAINPLQIKKSLESKKIDGLFFAGQINGTSGYEEAAGQGLIAGINASLKLENKEALDLKRWDSYIGVLIDDLITKGTTEPYRMLTSRAEYRLLLRNDNADQRLLKYAEYSGTLSQDEINKTKNKYKIIEDKVEELKTQFISTNDEIAKKYNINNSTSIYQVLARPEVNPEDILGCSFKYTTEVATIIRLEGYIKKQEIQAKRVSKLENMKIPNNINYDKVVNLATEARQKLELIKPETIGQATRISGINPSDIQMLMFHLKLRFE